jgi:hypothetical protein
MTDEKMQPNLDEQLEQTKPLWACSLSSSRLWTQAGNSARWRSRALTPPPAPGA